MSPRFRRLVVGDESRSEIWRRRALNAQGPGARMIDLAHSRRSIRSLHLARVWCEFNAALIVL